MIRPFLKWAGSKRSVAGQILSYIGSGRRLISPFCGSMALEVNAYFDEFTIADGSSSLIRIYQDLVLYEQEFIELCRKTFHGMNSSEAYYEARDRYNSLRACPEKSALMVALNRHCFNGLFRHNRSGAFNVPFGSYKTVYFPEAEMLDFIRWNRSKRALYVSQEFCRTFLSVDKGDVVYCDPPYWPLSDTASFTTYEGNTFTEADQIKLAELAEEAAESGAKVVVSNHDLPVVRELYERYGGRIVNSYSAARNINSAGDRRSSVLELVAVFGG